MLSSPANVTTIGKHAAQRVTWRFVSAMAAVLTSFAIVASDTSCDGTKILDYSQQLFIYNFVVIENVHYKPSEVLRISVKSAF